MCDYQRMRLSKEKSSPLVVIVTSDDIKKTQDRSVRNTGVLPVCVCSAAHSPAWQLSEATSLCLHPFSCRRTSHKQRAVPGTPKGKQEVTSEDCWSSMVGGSSQNDRNRCPLPLSDLSKWQVSRSVLVSMVTWAWLLFLSSHLSSRSSTGWGATSEPGALGRTQSSGFRGNWNGDEPGGALPVLGWSHASKIAWTCEQRTISNQPETVKQ